ncbi:MAG: hypothetical protein DRG33_00710 [Deltaproteobacteria bacterium]|nr:MAG: hypothetical protein DRG33_00710 [Deltaproteobacteria bacterium]
MPIEVQLHLWPWSEGISEETINLTKDEVSFQFLGSPALSISTRAELYLPRRYERFVPFGPPYKTLAGDYCLYEAPHGILASKYGKVHNCAGEIRINPGRETVLLKTQNARMRFVWDEKEKKCEETKLARTVVAWSQFFDDLLDSAKKAGRENRLPWAEAVKNILDIAEKDLRQPRKALIVDIAEQMRGKLQQIVAAARRILNRERLMMPADRVSEIDTACLRWMDRQPGETLIQKAATNRQRFLGIARRESFDTLENRVMKDFLRRCSHEGRRYEKTEVGDNPGLKQSERAVLVRQYLNLCTELGRTPFLEGVATPPSAPKPNYVLQNDIRYREIWHHYIRLLRREDAEDCLWDWQSRTWADVCRFLVCASIFDLSTNPSGEVLFKELLASAVRLAGEQRLGTRILAGSEPGPFLVTRRGQERSRASILEIVHPDQAGEHPATRHLGRTGGHLYLVLIPLSGGRPLVLILWAIHTAAAEQHQPWIEVGYSARRALQNHRRIFDQQREPDFPLLRGFIVASDMEATAADLHPGASEDLHLVQVPTDQRHWKEAIGGISLVIQDILEAVL